MLIDNFQRKVEYLRLSVTDLCNIRCHYCMPVEGIHRTPRSELLTFEEIARLVRVLAGLGIRKVRLTGGEPLIRPGIASLVRLLKRISDLEEVTLTTNGIYLSRFAVDLKEAGLDRLNIHMDTLSPEKFRTITRLGEIDSIFRGIAAAQEAGFRGMKLNCVLQRGINDDEVEAIIRFAADRGMVVRFIEMMPLGPGRDLLPTHFISAGEIRERLKLTWTLLPTTVSLGSGPAVYYKVGELNTLVGFISPISEPFCDTCNRIRISSDGRFQDCLAYDGRISLRDPKKTDEALAAEIESLMHGKREGHFGFIQEVGERNPSMYRIGG